jgi:hypothetical protein
MENFKDLDIENALMFVDNSTILGEGYKPLLCPVEMQTRRCTGVS